MSMKFIIHLMGMLAILTILKRLFFKDNYFFRIMEMIFFLLLLTMILLIDTEVYELLMNR